MPSERWFRRVLRLLPASFRDEYGREIVNVWRADMRDGRPGVRRRALVDTLRVAPREHAAFWVRSFALGARRCRREPGFAMAVVLTFALGTGAAGAVFSLVNAVLLRPLPWRAPDSVGLIWAVQPSEQRTWLSFAELEDLQRDSQTLASASGMTDLRPLLTAAGAGRELSALAVSHNMFSLLGVQPALGRDFAAEDDRPGAHATVILSHAFWRTQYANDPLIVGRTISLNGREYSVIGVLPESFELLPASSVLPDRADVWLPLEPHIPARDRSIRYLHAVARLRPGVSFAEAANELSAYGVRATAQYASVYTGGRWTFTIASFKDDVLGRVRPALFMLIALVSLVLLMACANVANLLLARGEARRTEMAIRSALGESPARLAGGLFAEALLLAAAGSALGLVLAWVLPAALISLDPGALPRLSGTRVDAHVLLFMTSLVVLASVFVVSAPLVERLRARTPVPFLVSRSAGRTPGSVRFGKLLVVAQTAFATTVVVATVVLASGFVRLLETDLGFTPDGVVSSRVTLLPKYHDAAEWTRVFEAMTSSDSTGGGAATIAAITQLPLSGAQLGSAFVTGASAQAPRIDADLRGVTPAYFDVMCVPVVAGRPFDHRDTIASPPVAIVDEGFARRLSPDGRVLGRRLRWIRQPDREVEIVGVVKSVRHRGPEEEPHDTVYRPLRQYSRSSVYLVMRSGQDTAGATASLRDAVARVDPLQPLGDVATMTERVTRSTSRTRTSLMLAGVLAALALALAFVGLYGVLSFAVARRRREFGVRMTLGARPADVRRMVLREGLALTALGSSAGLVGAALATAGPAAAWIDASGGSPGACAAGAAIVIVSSAVAFWLPARKASRVEPIVTLRAE